MRGQAVGTLAKLGGNVVALGSVLTGKALIACGLRRPPEGWRRTLGILLRSEPTRFALSAFGLHAADAGTAAEGRASVERLLAERLRAYLDGQSDAHFLLEWRDAVTIRHRTPSVDVVLLRFSASGELQNIEPYLAAGTDSTAADRDQVHRAIIAAYNGTRLLPEIDRPRAVRKSVDSPYARRVLSACCLSFED
ncbi:MAG TPA: hypothetical protein VKB36_20900, partial [Vicinamibacterales bacterium]|nr:hypothetical protein [Vicinamibacterales bacterium]